MASMNEVIRTLSEMVKSSNATTQAAFAAALATWHDSRVEDRLQKCAACAQRQSMPDVALVFRQAK